MRRTREHRFIQIWYESATEPGTFGLKIALEISRTAGKSIACEHVAAPPAYRRHTDFPALSFIAAKPICLVDAVT